MVRQGAIQGNQMVKLVTDTYKPVPVGQLSLSLYLLERDYRGWPANQDDVGMT